MTTLNGADFVAVVRLTDKPGNVLARPEKTCEKVPASSLGWLLRAGKIRRRDTTSEETNEKRSPEVAEAEREPKTVLTKSQAPRRRTR